MAETNMGSDVQEQVLSEVSEASSSLQINRRSFLAGAAGAAFAAGLEGRRVLAQSATSTVNLARVAIPSSFVTTSENKISALNDGAEPSSSRDRNNARYVLRRDREQASEALPWVQYTWSAPVAVNKVDVYWAIDPPRPPGIPGSEWGRTKAPAEYRILYWNGSDFVPVPQAKGLGIQGDQFNATTFDPGND